MGKKVASDTVSPIWLALDFMKLDVCLELCGKVGHLIHGVKIHDLYDRKDLGGINPVTELKKAGARNVFVDLKLHDIQRTVGARGAAVKDAVLQAADDGADALSVHASGHVEMMEYAVEYGPAQIYAITVLTSLSPDQVLEVYNRPVKDQVAKLANLAGRAGVSGIVCSALEVEMLNSMRGRPGTYLSPEVKFVVPGTRSPGVQKRGQKRSTTPAQAMAAGADWLVIGSEATKAEGRMYSNPKNGGILREEELLRTNLEWTRSLNPEKVAPGAVTQGVVTHFLKQANAFWMHDGDPKRPHVRLTSGKHSDGFVNVLKLLVHTPVCMMFARELVGRLRQSFPLDPEWVVGSDHAGVSISMPVAILTNAKYDFTVKADKDGRKIQKWRGHRIEPGEMVLQVEELITTFATTDAVRTGILEANGATAFHPALLTVVNRSGHKEYEGRPIISLAEYDISTWEPDDCELCRKGSPVLLPKDNWAQLVG
jgi:orotidine-5'-phosphate decarboxylase